MICSALRLQAQRSAQERICVAGTLAYGLTLRRFCLVHPVGALHPQLVSNSAPAITQECHPGTGSLCRSRSKSSSRPCFCEYPRLRILTQLLLSRSAT
jgi:hypothetical protein